MMVDSQKADFLNTAGLDLPRKETEHIKTYQQQQQQEQQQQIGSAYFIYNLQGKYALISMKHIFETHSHVLSRMILTII